jgi:hypothetical protein
MIIKSPWALMIPRKTKSPKRYAMSLSNYRNQHHRSNAGAKVHYSKQMKPQVQKLRKFTGPVGITLTMYPPSKRRYDLDNWGSVTAKFFQDCLVENKKILDDDSTHITKVTFVPGTVDPKDPRIEIAITQEETDDQAD